MLDLLEGSKSGALTYKNIFDIPNSTLIHVCNIAGGFGRGFAAQVNLKYPDIKPTYQSLYRQGLLELGKTSKHRQEHQTVMNMYAMPDYKRYGSDKTCYLDYNALDKGLWDVNYCYEGVVVLPYGMGAGNAGGDWSKVLKYLDANLPFYVVCKLLKE